MKQNYRAILLTGGKYFNVRIEATSLLVAIDLAHGIGHDFFKLEFVVCGVWLEGMYEELNHVAEILYK
jgi:hypothetical protein